MNIAHRGGAQLMPENTLAAFADALARGCDGVELDVQLSRDDVAVVHHDWRLMKDVARRDGAWLTEPGPRIKDLTLAELRQFDVGTVRPGSDYALSHALLKPVNAPVPTLEEVVALAKGAGRRFVLFVELKCSASEDSADPQTLADFFDTRKFPGRRALSRATAKYNLEMALLADGVAPKDVYATLATQEGLTRAFAKLQALNPIWAHDSIGALRWVKDGQAVMATVLNGDISAEKDFTPHVIWDHQLYELDVFGIPAGDPARRRAQEYIAYATGSEALAGMARWMAYGPARRSAFALVKPNPETGADLRPLLPTNPDNFHQAFAINERWWLDHGADIAPRWQEFVSR